MSGVVVLAASIPVLGYIGFHNIASTREGRRVDAENDPTKPNYEANVVPTPVMLLAQSDGKNITGLTMLSLGANDSGGGVLFIPVDTVADDVVPAPQTDESTTTTTTAPGTPPPKITLTDAYSSKGDFALEQLTSNVLSLSFESVVTLTNDQLTEFFTPVAPLTIKNPDRITQAASNGKAAVTFPAGDIELDADEVAMYLEAHNSKESDLARLARHELVWRAWLAAIKSSTNPDVVPGETASGLGRYLRGLAKGDVRFASLPATPSTDAEGHEVFTPDTAATDSLVSSLVPLSTPANPGDRVRVRLLSGVGPLDAPALLAADLVPKNAQVTLVGNADRFDYAETEIVYYDDGFAPAAEELKSLLGLGKVSKRTTSADFEDVTLIIGRDLVDQRGLKITQGSNSQ